MKKQNIDLITIVLIKKYI